MTNYYNRKYNFTVEADRIEPGKPYEGFGTSAVFGKFFAEIPEAYWLVKHENTKMLISDELFQRFFVPEAVHA